MKSPISELSYSYCILLHHLSYTSDTILPGSAHKLAFGPLALGHYNPTVCSLVWRWRLWSALRAAQESFSIESGPLLDSKARLYSSKLSYSYCILSTIYPTPWTPSFLAWVQRTQAGLQPNSARKLVVRPPTLGHHNPTVCSLACRWRQRSAMVADWESFSIDYTAHSCPTATVWDPPPTLRSCVYEILTRIGNWSSDLENNDTLKWSYKIFQGIQHITQIPACTFPCNVILQSLEQGLKCWQTTRQSVPYLQHNFCHGWKQGRWG